MSLSAGKQHQAPRSLALVSVLAGLALATAGAAHAANYPDSDGTS